MRKHFIGKLLVIVMVAVLLCGCQKEGAKIDPDMPQPVLGENKEGYGGFSHMQAYVFGEKADHTVVYLPKDELAFMGDTSIICTKDGVEVSLNYMPLYSEEVADKTLKHKLDHSLCNEFNDIYTKNYKALKISDITALHDDAVTAEVSYLTESDDNKGFVAYWVQYYLVELEDGREFRVVTKISSDGENENTAALISEMERYLGIDIAYEPGMLQAQIDNYNPSEQEVARMEGTVVEVGSLDIVLPKFWIRNSAAEKVVYAVAADKNYNWWQVYTETESETDTDFNTYIIIAEADSEISSGEYGALEKGEIEVLERIYEELVLQMYPGVSVETDAITDSELGFVLEIDLSGIDGVDGIMYTIVRGNKTYVILGSCMEPNKEDSEEIREIMRDVLKNSSARK